MIYTAFERVNQGEFIATTRQIYADIQVDMPDEADDSLVDALTLSHGDSLLGVLIFSGRLGVYWVHYISTAKPHYINQLLRTGHSFCAVKSDIAVEISLDLKDIIQQMGYHLVTDYDEARSLFTEPTSVDDDYAIVKKGVTPSYDVEIVRSDDYEKLRRSVLLFKYGAVKQDNSRMGWKSRPSRPHRKRYASYEQQEASPSTILGAALLTGCIFAYMVYKR